MPDRVSRLIADATCGDVTPVSFAGVPVPVLHPSMWPPAAIVALADGDWASWAALCTADNGEAWADVDGDRDALVAFAAAVDDATGQPLQVVADVMAKLDRYPDELTADLRRFYHVDVRALWSADPAARLSYPMVRAYIEHLPPESAFKTAVRDRMTSKDFEDASPPEGWGPWSRTDELLAVLIDRVAWLQYVSLSVAGGKPSEPEPIRRPGVGLSGREQRIQAALTAAHVQYLRDHDGASPPVGWDHGVDIEAID